MKWTRDALYGALQHSVATVTFTKVNGDQREMNCTLVSSYLPEEYREKGELLTEADPKTLRVWELNNGWRSFRIDSVISVDFLNEGKTKTPNTLLLG